MGVDLPDQLKELVIAVENSGICDSSQSVVQLVVMESSQRTLTWLIDDCLYDIFISANIDICDLVEIASTCKRFRKIARQVFEAKFKRADYFSRMHTWSMEKIISFFMCFGEFCEMFDTRHIRCPVSTLLHLLAKYCTNLVHLRWCAVNKYGSIAQTIDYRQLEKVCSQLVQYDYFGGTSEGLRLFDENSPLKTLQLYYFPNGAQLPELHLPQLRHVKLAEFPIVKSNNFFMLNNQITRLELRDIRSCHNGLEDAIGHLVHLEELTYTEYNRPHYFSTYAGFKNLTKLRQLQIHAPITSTVRILNAMHAANVPLESLILANLNINIEIIDAICQYQSIKQMRVCDGVYLGSRKLSYRQNLVQLVTTMPELKHFYCESGALEVDDMCNILGHSNQLESARFVIATCPNCEKKYSNVGSIPAVAKTRNIRIDIAILSDHPRHTGELVINQIFLVQTLIKC